MEGPLKEVASMEINSLLAREAIRDCLARVGRGEDRRDAEVIRGCFWPDASTDFGIFVGTFAEYLNWVVPGSPAILVTLHTLGQSLIDLQGDAAAVETHITSYHRVNMGSEERDLTIGGRYLDRMEKRNGEWRIARRTMMYDWLRDFGTSVDWSQGVLGTPFLGDHSVGAARGDASEAFFKLFREKR
jgi:hypothetical protein